MKIRKTSVLTYILMILSLSAMAFPVIFLTITSFKLPEDIYSNALIFPPTLKNFIDLLFPASPEEPWRKFFLPNYLNTIIISGLSTAIATLIGTPTAYALSRLRVKGAKNIAMLFLSFRFLPVVIVMMPLFLLFQALGIFDTYFGVILAYQLIALPYIVWMLEGFFDEIPRELTDAARVDGYSHLGILYRILLPAAKTSFVVTILIAFLFCWNDLVIALILTRKLVRTGPVRAVEFFGAWGVPIEWGVVTAASFILSFPLFFVIIFLQRYLVRALTFGIVRK